MNTPPPRPRLADHVRARMHVIDGERVVNLHDTRATDLVQVDAASWRVLAAADGTRDLEGIALAVSRSGARPAREAIERLFAALHARGLLAEGPPATLEDAVEPSPRDSDTAARPLEPLPEVRVGCDGRGACCRLFGSVLLTPADQARALGAYGGALPFGLRPSELLLPERGSAPWPVRVPVQRDGACGFLEQDGRCGIHARAGVAAKPWGCAAFPLRFCDDGTAVRVSMATECRCVLLPPASADAPLLDPGWRTAADLPPLQVIDALPPEVPIGAGRVWTRAALRAWVEARVETSRIPDLAGWLWAEAESLDPSPGGPEPWFVALAERAAIVTRREAAWRGRDDLGQQALVWLRVSASALALEHLRDAVPLEPAMEALYVRAALWGYADAGRLPWADVLRDRAVRIWLARTMSALRSDEEASATFDAPLAFVDALVRTRGIQGYVPTHRVRNDR